jgi:hypothetical protein
LKIIDNKELLSFKQKGGNRSQGSNNCSSGRKNGKLVLEKHLEMVGVTELFEI